MSAWYSGGNMLPTQRKPTLQERIDAFLLFYFEGIFKPPLNTDLGFLRKTALILVMSWGGSLLAAVLWAPIFLGFVFSITLLAAAVWLRQWRETQDRQQRLPGSRMSRTQDSPLPPFQQSLRITHPKLVNLSIMITFSAMMAPMMLFATLCLMFFFSHQSKALLALFFFIIAAMIIILREKPWESEHLLPRSKISAIASIVSGSFIHILVIAVLVMVIVLGP